MKLLLILLFPLQLLATNYYFSNAGNDSNPGTISQPFATTTKANALFPSLVTGDSLLFKAGDTFYGTLIPTKAGASTKVIVYGKYSTGSDPKITGLTTVTGLTAIGGNIYRANVPAGLSTLNMVVINNAIATMGRFPDESSSYLVYQSHSGNTSITSSSLSGTPNWTGAEVVVRTNRAIWERKTITSQSGGTLSFAATNATPQNGYGFFIENSLNTLTVNGEWYYNPGTKDFYIYWTGTLPAVQVSTLNNLVDLDEGSSAYKSHITFKNINFSGSEKDAVLIQNDSAIIFDACRIEFAGANGIDGNGTTGIIVRNCTIRNCNNDGINFYDRVANSGQIFTNNTITNMGLKVGLVNTTTTTNTVQNIGVAINSAGNTQYIYGNTVDSTAYDGINAGAGNDIVIRRNIVTNFCLFRDDGAGIYMVSTVYSPTFTGRYLDSNFVFNGQNSSAGTNNSQSETFGIYFDDRCVNVYCSHNTVYNIPNSGIFLHDAQNMQLRDNVVYNCGKQQVYFFETDPEFHLVDIMIHRNVLFCVATNQLALYDQRRYSPLDSLGVGLIDSNYYERPLLDNLTLRTTAGYPSETTVNYNLASWQAAFTGRDVHSHKSPRTVSSTDSVRLLTNPSASPVVIDLGAKWLGYDSTVYDGSATVPEYSSIPIIYYGPATGGSNDQPTATITNSGAGVVRTLPTDTLTLFGFGTDSDGTIASYLWTKLSGPVCTINTPTTANTLLSGLTQGTYQFQLTVTDNEGATGSATVTITVNGLPAVCSTPTMYKNGIYIGQINCSSFWYSVKKKYNYRVGGMSGTFLVTTGNKTLVSIAPLAKGTYTLQVKLPGYRWSSSTNFTIKRA